MSNKGINEYLGNITTLLNELVQEDVIEHNPALGIRKLPEIESEGFIPPTDQEFELIKEELKKQPFGFWLYCLLIYQTGIRPRELNKLQVKDIHFDELIIRLEPENDGVSQKTKNKKFRNVPITPGTAGLLKQQIGDMPMDAFVFGRKTKCTIEYCHRNRYSSFFTSPLLHRFL